MIPDASKTLVKASQEQNMIGWDHWLKGRISREWETLVNCDIKNEDSGIKYNLSEKWAQEDIAMSWDFIHDMWLQKTQ
jgi:hypothetical protein